MKTFDETLNLMWIFTNNFFEIFTVNYHIAKKNFSLLFMLYLLNSQRCCCSSIRFSTSTTLESNFLFLWRWKLQRFARTIWPFVSQFPDSSLTSFPTNGYTHFQFQRAKNTVGQNWPKKSHFKTFHLFTPLESVFTSLIIFAAKIQIFLAK